MFFFLADDHLAANQTGEAHQKNAIWTAAKNNCPERDSHKGQTCGPIGKRKRRNLFFSALQVHLDPEILDLGDQQRFYRCLPVSRDLQTVKTGAVTWRSSLCFHWWQRKSLQNVSLNVGRLHEPTKLAKVSPPPQPADVIDLRRYVAQVADWAIVNDFLDDKDREHGQEQQSVEGKMCSAGAEKNSNLGSGISAQRCGFSTSETESVPPGAKRIGRGPLCRKKRKSSNGSLLTMNGRFRTRWHNDTRNTGKCKRKAKIMKEIC